MNATMRRVVIGATAVSMALSIAACGKAGDDDSDSSSSDSKSIGLLLPDSVTARYEKFDKPLFEAKVKELCSDCDVQYANAAADPNAGQFKEGAHNALDGKVKIAYEQSGLWKDTVAAQKMSAAITQLGAKNIAGVYAANDGMAGGIANTLKGAKISGIPLTGQDAELAGIQRIVAGTQSSTVYKAFKPEADAAAQLAVNLLEGKDIKSLATTTLTSGSGDKVPSQLLTPVSVTKANIKDTVIADGTYKAADVCTSDFASACTANGIK
jgi:ABC-type xylose transport system substrate-binding protein